MGKINKLIADMARIEKLNEALVFELCDKHELSLAEEMTVFELYHKAMSTDNSSVDIKEALKPVEPPKQYDVYAPTRTFTHNFSMA